MKIKELKVNNFGNLKEKEIEFGEHINIIEGKNESGKSTLLKFITNLFYGASKNKKGKEFSDYDRYKPWNGEEFSGKLKYELDNKKQYEVFRDFSKKNPTIYNENLEDISKNFTIDKTNGNQFFVEQTGIDETTFLSTLVTMQQEVKLDSSIQNTLVQKIANITGTGDDNVSYKKAIDKINKKQLEEIGTARSQGRPINIVKEEKYDIQDEIGELENYKERQYEINNEKQELEKEIKIEEERLEELRKIKNQKEQENIQEEKINLSKKMIDNQNEKLKELQENKEQLEKQKSKINDNFENVKEEKSKKIAAIISFIAAVIIEISNVIILKNTILGILFALIIILSIVVFILENKRQKPKKEKQKENIKQKKQAENYQIEIEKINAQIEILKSNILEQNTQIEEQTKLINYNTNEKDNLSNIKYEIENLEKQLADKKLQYHSLELEENLVKPKLEKVAQLEEKLEELNVKEKELENENNAIEYVKEILEIAYQKMKQNVTPKLTEQLSKNIRKISNEKYTKINLHEENGMIAEKENGEYIEVQKLSIGTIDQLYLSLRLAMAKELSKETMPIILDEAFAYYDNERLENILKYLDEEFKNYQIIILTSSSREKDILDKNNIKYNNIKL